MRENLIVSHPVGLRLSAADQAAAHNSLSLYARSGDHLPRRAALHLPRLPPAHRPARLGARAPRRRHGATVAVMDWDSHRYLESYFAIPMMGATLLTVNVRLSPEQIALHAEPFATPRSCWCTPISCRCSSRSRASSTACADRVVLTDGQAVPQTTLPVRGRIRGAARAGARPISRSATSTRTPRRPPSTPPARPATRRACASAIASSCCTRWRVARACARQRDGQRLHRDDVYMPITPMFHVHAWGLPYVATMLGLKQVYPGRYVPEALLS